MSLRRSESPRRVGRSASPGRGRRPATTKRATPTNAATGEVDTMGGPLLKLAVMLAGPTFLQFAWASCELDRCQLSTTLWRVQSWNAARNLLWTAPTIYSLYLFAFWMATQLAFRVFLPAKHFVGYLQRDGVRLDYRLNGLASLIATALLYTAAVAGGLFDLARVEAEARAFVTLFQLAAFVVSALLVVRARLANVGERSGSLLTDYFFGSEITPRLLDSALLDVKFFFETHALIMWLVVDALFAWRHAGAHNALAVGVTLTVHVVYVVHHMLDESFVLGIMDFTSENMGWMLTWGNMVHVGLYFPLSLMYVAKNSIDLSWPSAIAILTLGAYGLLMFSEANHQKHQFRQNPDRPIWGSTPRSFLTRRGTALLISGWWSIGRKMNYTGDLILALCHGLSAGFDSLMPHLYFIYLTALLLHRARRDDAACRAKYGADWDEYCAIVPYAMLPGLF